MVDYQCPTCFEAMDKPKYSPVALKCGHIMCSSCLPRIVKRGQANHVCSICREECAPENAYRVYLPTPIHSLPSTSSSSNASSGSSGLSLSNAQFQQAHAIADAASRLGVESSEPELKRIVTSAEQWYLKVDQPSDRFRDALDTLLSAITALRRKLVYSVRLDSAKDLQLETQMKVDMYRSEIANYEERFHRAELEIATARREANQWEKHAKRAEAKAAQWEKQTNVLEERRYTDSIRAEGAVGILRSQIGVLQKEVLEQTQRKLKYKKKYYAAKQPSPKNKPCPCHCTPSDDDSLEIMSPTSTADEAEVSAAFSVPLMTRAEFSQRPTASQSRTPPLEQDIELDADDDDDSQTIIYGPPSRPQHQRKRKLSTASASTTTSTASISPLEPEEQCTREAALDGRFSKRLRMARQEGVKEGWVPPDWKARVVMADRIKDMKGSRKRALDMDAMKPEGVKSGNSSKISNISTGQSQNNARTIRSKRA